MPDNEIRALLASNRGQSGLESAGAWDDGHNAERLRAWCLEQGWNVVLNCYPDLAVVSVYSADDEFLAQAWVGATADFADLSTIQRERLATGRAVARAIEAPEAQYEP